MQDKIEVIVPTNAIFKKSNRLLSTTRKSLPLKTGGVKCPPCETWANRWASAARIGESTKRPPLLACSAQGARNFCSWAGLISAFRRPPHWRHGPGWFRHTCWKLACRRGTLDRPTPNSRDVSSRVLPVWAGSKTAKACRKEQSRTVFFGEQALGAAKETRFLRFYDNLQLYIGVCFQPLSQRGVFCQTLLNEVRACLT